MKIAIHHRKEGFSSSWIDYCTNQNIPHKIVNAYSNTIVEDLSDCDAFMWHFHHANSKDTLFAKQLLFSLENAGKVVFPDFNTSWHFDDKVGQKYLLESMGMPLVPTHVFYDKKSTLSWIKRADYPKVFKLRGGSGSSNVKLVNDKKAAANLVNKAFGTGFKQYEPLANFRERWRTFKQNKTGLLNLLKGLIRFGYTTEYSRVAGRERGYVYFQDFIANCDGDFRIKVVGDKCWGFKRIVRENDFRASGSGKIDFKRELITPDILETAFSIAEKLNLQVVAFDFVLDKKKKIYLLEMSYGFGMEDGQLYGYWDRQLNWHEGPFNPFGWMVETVVSRVEEKEKSRASA